MAELSCLIGKVLKEREGEPVFGLKRQGSGERIRGFRGTIDSEYK